MSLLFLYFGGSGGDGGVIVIVVVAVVIIIIIFVIIIITIIIIIIILLLLSLSHTFLSSVGESVYLWHILRQVRTWQALPSILSSPFLSFPSFSLPQGKARLTALFR